ncbi:MULTISPECIES: TIGR03086 family metal-binding protein [Pseudofrankia]|uniref:TIGR03086 family metal-binding protein n=1 Tax=Pseudofrankia TaxID=2994363 RepID=UPI000234CA4D|nr:MULTISPECIES: TIGR03086 family metal-binding protein [Pseudofrankia]OHV41516.1 TIGR03086 family protein [Pseudofrankia sp. EUN1h]
MTSYDILVAAEHRLVELIGSFTRDELARPTPCAGWDVRALVSHTLAGIEIFASTVDGGPAPTAEMMFSGTDLLGDDPAGAAKRAVTRSQAAWADLADPERELTTILGPLPAGEMLAISAFATVVHAWDLTLATNRPVRELPGDLLAHADDVARRYVPTLRAGDDHSLFQPEIPAPADANPTQRLMAFLGRDPLSDAAR